MLSIGPDTSVAVLVVDLFGGNSRQFLCVSAKAR